MWGKFAVDSPLEGDGFELSVPGRETVKLIVGDGTTSSKTEADLLGNRNFESISSSGESAANSEVGSTQEIVTPCGRLKTPPSPGNES